LGNGVFVGNRVFVMIGVGVGLGVCVGVVLIFSAFRDGVVISSFINSAGERTGVRVSVEVVMVDGDIAGVGVIIGVFVMVGDGDGVIVGVGVGVKVKVGVAVGDAVFTASDFLLCFKVSVCVVLFNPLKISEALIFMISSALIEVEKIMHNISIKGNM
jgi:hypothetical protein